MKIGEKTMVGDRVKVYPRGKKQLYVADFWQDGVHRKVSLKTANKKVATARATVLAAELLQGTFRQAAAPADVQLTADAYVASLKTNGRARKTLVKYAGTFRIFVAFLLLQRIGKLHQITGSHFDAWRAQRLATRAPKTVYTQSVVVKQLLRWAKSRKLIADDPLAGIKLAKPFTRPKGGPSFEQLNALLAAADAELAVWLLFLALTGMRVGELQRLRREDVDFAGRWIHIRSRPGAETKTRASRKVPMHPRLRAALEALPSHPHAWFFTAAPSRKYPGGGNWISPKRVNDRFLRLLKRLGLPAGRESGFVIHSLRHFFETHTVNARTPQLAIDVWLGHQSNKTMAAVYYNLHDADSQKFMGEVPFELSGVLADARPLPEFESPA